MKKSFAEKTKKLKRPWRRKNNKLYLPIIPLHLVKIVLVVTAAVVEGMIVALQHLLQIILAQEDLKDQFLQLLQHLILL